MIAQPTSIPAPTPPINLEEEVLLLRATLNDALGRIGNLEQRLSQIGWTEIPVAAARPLVARDSAEMTFALQLCQEVFPGCIVDVEVESDPSEPEWPWYTVCVRWAGEVRDTIDRQMAWHERLAQAHPHLGDQFRMIVDLP